MSGGRLFKEGRRFADPWPKPAKGSVKGNHVRVACGFDPETFDYLRARAVREGTSVAEQVRLFTEWGIESSEAGESK